MTTSKQRAYAFWWRELDRWMVPALQHSGKLPEGWRLVRVTELVKQVTEKVKVDSKSEYKLAGVKWYGEGMFYRETVSGTSTSATHLTPLIPGAFVYNRLFAWKESFAVVPEELRNCLVSSEFPQFLVDETCLLARYLYLFFMCQSTVKAVNKASIGSAAVSRNRFKEEHFLNFQIPLPPIPVQQAIVDRWQQSRREVAEVQTKASQLEEQRKLDFLAALGSPGLAARGKKKCFSLPWSQLDRWSIEYLLRASFGEGAIRWHFPTEPLARLAKGQSGGTPATTNSLYWNGDIPWVSPKDMKTFSIGDSIDHISKDAVSKSSAPLLPEKAVLIVVRSGILQRCVPIAITEVPVSINQDMRGYSVTDERLDAEFLAYFLEARSSDLLSLVKWSTTVQSINREELEAYSIPLPPIDVQRRLVKQADKQRRAILKQREESAQRVASAKAEMESMILGAKKIHLCETNTTKGDT